MTEFLAILLFDTAAWFGRDFFLRDNSKALDRAAELEPVMSQDIAGRQVDYRPYGLNDHESGGVATASLFVRLPADVEVRIGEELRGNGFFSRADFESALQVKGLRQDRVIRALHHPRVDRALRAALVSGAAVRIEKRRVWLGLDDARQPQQTLLSLAAEVAEAFDAAWRLPWEDARTSLGLTWHGEDLIGTVDDVQIRAAEIPVPMGWRVEIEAELTPALAPGFSVTRGVGGIEVGDLMVDSVLCIQSSDADEARRLLTGPSVREPLLELIHGHPRSQITRDAIDFQTDSWLGSDELVRHVNMLVTLALALRRVSN